MLERLKHNLLFCSIGLAARQAVSLTRQLLYSVHFLQLSEHFEQGTAVALADVEGGSDLFGGGWRDSNLQKTQYVIWAQV